MGASAGELLLPSYDRPIIYGIIVHIIYYIYIIIYLHASGYIFALCVGVIICLIVFFILHVVL